MIPGLSYLGALRLTAAIQALQDVRELPQELLFLRMHPVTPSTEMEILLRFVGRVQIADIISDDAKAVTYNWRRMQTETNVLPNLKAGINLTQSQIAQLNAIASAGGPAAGPGVLDGLYTDIAEMLLLGIRQRWETLFIAAYQDSLNYDRGGIKLSGVKFGTPADLKATPSIAWDHQTGGVYDATPVTDVWTMRNIAQQRYGIVYDRMISSTAAFQYAVSTTEFQNRARARLSLNQGSVTGSALGLLAPAAVNDEEWLRFAAPVFGVKEWILYDARYWSEDSSGAEASYRFMDPTQVFLCASMNDGKGRVLDMQNVETVESQVMGLVPTAAIGTLPKGTVGPIAYATPADPSLNPPGITAWGVARSWPRKWQQQMNAALKVGTFTDIISAGVPFPVL